MVFYALGLGALMLFDTLTQVCFKMASTNAGAFALQSSWVWSVVRKPWIYGAVAGYVGSFVSWMTLLKRAPVGPAFAASHLEVVAVLVVSVLVFGERLAPPQIAGALFIVLGIVFLSISEARRAHD
jgi:drug/metabolite transporter (DMT)-like permease